MPFKIPRAQRQVEDASEVSRVRTTAPTAGAEATEQLGRAISGLGVVAAKFGRAQDRLAREEALNRSVDAANQVQQDSVKFLADERGKAGLDTLGTKADPRDNVKRYDDFLEELIQARTADLPDNIKALTRQRLESSRLKNRTDLATHQQEQRRGVTLSNLDQARDNAVQESSNNPSLGTINDQLKSVSKTINLYKANGSIDTEDAQDRFTEARESIITSAVTSAIMIDADSGQSLLDETKAVLPSEVVKSLEKDIRNQRKLQKDEDEATRKQSVQDFQNSLITSAVDGEVPTETSVRLSPAWELMSPSEQKDTLKIIRDADPLKKSDPVVKADFTTRVNTAPETLTEQDFIDAHGVGLSTADFQTLITKWRKDTESENTPAQSGQKQAYKILNDAKTKRIYDSDDLENEFAWASATQALDVFVEENPNAEAEEYTDFVEKLLTIPEKDFINRFFDLFSDDKGIRFRAEAIKELTEAGRPVTENNIAHISDQIEAQRGE